MVSNSNVAMWQIADFAELYEQSIVGDKITSEPFVLKHPEFGELKFCLRFELKTNIDPNLSRLHMTLMDASHDFPNREQPLPHQSDLRQAVARFPAPELYCCFRYPIKCLRYIGYGIPDPPIPFAIECDSLMETINKKRSVTRTVNLSFNRGSKYESWCFLTFEQLAEFFHSLPSSSAAVYHIQSDLLVQPRKSTLYRWPPINDFESRFNDARFGTPWESEQFEVPEFKGVKFTIHFIQKVKLKSTQIFHHFILTSRILLVIQNCRSTSIFGLNGKGRLYKTGLNYEFTTLGYCGYQKYLWHGKLIEFAKKKPITICCDVQAIIDPLRLSEVFFPNEIGSFFNNSSLPDAKICVGKTTFTSINIPKRLEHSCRYTVDGRYLFSSSSTRLQISDIFHSKTRYFEFQFSPKLLVNGHVCTFTSKPSVDDLYPLNLDSVLMSFNDKSYSGSSLYLGVGRVDLEKSVVFVEQAIYHNGYTFNASWIPSSFPPDLKSGILYQGMFNYPSCCGYIALQTDERGILRKTSVIEKPVRTEAFAVKNEFVYGLAERTEIMEVIGIDMMTLNLSTGKIIRQPTSNWEELKDLYRWQIFTVVGKHFFTHLHSQSDNTSFLVSLDTESLEWKIRLTLNGRIDELISDRTRTLIVRVRTNPKDPSVVQYYRFVMDGPEKLSTLAWLQLNKMFADCPSLYESVLRKLPATFNLKYTPL